MDSNHFPFLDSLASSLQWEGKEVVRDVDGSPQLFERLTLQGPRFDERAMEPFVQVGKVKARTVEIAGDGKSVRAYFDEPIPRGEMIEFGYEESGVLYRYPTRSEPDKLIRLDRARLPPKTKLPEAERE